MKKTILSVLSVLVLGALGSGLWDLGIKPAGSYIFFQGLKLSTKLTNYFVDGLFERASRGYTEYSSDTLFSIFIVFMCFLYALLPLRIFQKRKELKELIEKAKNIKDKNKNKTDSSELDKDLDDVSRKAHGMLTERLSKKKLYLFSILSISAITTLIVMSARTGASKGVVTYTLNSIEIVSPYISNKEQLLLKSNFYQMRSKKDFDKINEKLKKVETDHNLKLPRLDWLF